MKTINLKKNSSHFIAILIFFLISFIYFNPASQGYRVRQHDNNFYKGVSKEIEVNREKTGKQALWTNSLFGGMPSYQVSFSSKNNLTKYIPKIITVNLPIPMSTILLGLIGFYILLLTFNVPWYFSVIGSIAFSFSSYYFIIIASGHMSKAHAMSMMGFIFAGVALIYNKRKILGTSIFGISLALQIHYNHLQITYYLFFVILFYILSMFVKAIKDKTIPDFIKSSLIALLALVLIISANATILWTTLEYTPYSTRGKSELTFNKSNKTSGLDKDYATSWSYRMDETFTFLVPNYMGGSSSEELSKESNTYTTLKKYNVPNARSIIKQVSLYWGDQPFTSGPVYIGAVLIFLFIYSLFFIKKNPLKIALLLSTILGILFSWDPSFTIGRFLVFSAILISIVAFYENFVKKEKVIRRHHVIYGIAGFLILLSFVLPKNITNYPFAYFLLDNLPLYNKFRAHSISLVIPQFTIPFLGMITLNEIFNKTYSKQEVIRKLIYSLIITTGVLLVFILFGSSLYSFENQNDTRIYPDWLIEAIEMDRLALLKSDSFRALIYVLAFSVIIWLSINNKLKLKISVLLIGLLITVDLWTVANRYLNNKKDKGRYIHWQKKAEHKNPYKPTYADKIILNDKDPNFRVLNVSVSTFQDASTSYFHKSIGGYHAAKMKRYQELIEHQISKNNINVLNMLNTKYFIVAGENKVPMPQKNPNAFGNAWFIDTVVIVNNSDEEILALSDFDPKKEVIVNKDFEEHINKKIFVKDTGEYINLKSYGLDTMIYESNTIRDKLAVFSEIYYPIGWKVYIDGEESNHFRANYVLRAMNIPGGKHEIKFIFEPKSYYIGEKIALSSSILLILLFIYGLAISAKKHFITK